jgi:hypothetical protein
MHIAPACCWACTAAPASASAASLLVPPVMAAPPPGAPHPWQWAWILLGALALVASLVTLPARLMPTSPAQAAGGGRRARAVCCSG